MTAIAPNTHHEGTFIGVGGVSIFWQAWLPPGPCRGVVVIAHGAGEHSGRYLHVADRLVREGYAVYALDHRGHGRSGGPRALVDRMDNVVADLDTLILQAAADQGAQARLGLPVFLLGHSMGGTVSLCYALRHQDRPTPSSSRGRSPPSRRRHRSSGLSPGRSRRLPPASRSSASMPHSSAVTLPSSRRIRPILSYITRSFPPAP